MPRLATTTGKALKKFNKKLESMMALMESLMNQALLERQQVYSGIEAGEHLPGPMHVGDNAATCMFFKNGKMRPAQKSNVGTHTLSL